MPQPSILDNVTEVPSVPKSIDDMVYVSIPAEDLYENDYPTIQLNRTKFLAGHTYKVPAIIASEIEDRMKKFNREQVRLLNPRTDRKALDDVNRGSNWARGAITTHEAAMASLGASDKIIEVREL